MAEAVISAAVEVALSKAISVLEDQINLAWDFKDDLNKLRSSLLLTRAFLQDAERRQLDEPVKVWLEQLRDIACKADVVLDELAYEHFRRKVDTRKRTQVSNFFSPSKNSLAITLKMAKKVKTISQSIKDVNSQATELGLQQRLQVSAPVSRGVGGGTHSLVDSSRVVGREADVQRVVNLLIGSTTHQTLSIASIVGMGGLGKTTLAKILVEMLESLTRKSCEIKNEDVVLREIQKELKEKSFLLVLDDVWDEDIKNWEDLRGSLQGINESKPSWVLVTSRSENVALVRETPVDHRHHLKAVKDEECWSIIKERAFGNFPPSPDLEAIGRDIAHKCGGVPLVAMVIGGTMCNKWDRDECFSHMVMDFKGLRVLKFSGADIELLPDSIGKLKHLRYFDISGTDICRLPKAIAQLYLLETLRLLKCFSIRKLPGGTKNLVNLRHLYTSDGRLVPVEIGCLTSLQTLATFRAGTEKGRGIGELGYLIELRGELVIRGLESVRNKEEARGARLWEKKKLLKLTYMWDCVSHGCNEQVLEGLEPHSNLKSLTIKFYNGECFPSWLVQKIGGDPSACFQPMNLVELKILQCWEVKNLPALGQFPNLKFLEVELGPFSEEVEEFPGLGSIHHLHSSLKQLALTGWETLHCSFPHQLQHLTAVEQLEIRDFDGLKALPEWLGNLSSLRSLCLVGCNHLVHLPSEEALQRLHNLHSFDTSRCRGLRENKAELSKLPTHSRVVQASKASKR
ncbi:hypothetical protein V6N13_132951 [Hibiscus sabdariffa]|uniref:Uncharacterized protein n=1 Tax=Hibiscus sabdariffa TaxID=183260 RepID=A0ABR2PWU9_9ROSI